MYFTLTKINLNLTILEDPPCKAIMSPPKIFGENHAIVFVSKNEFVFFFLRKKKKKNLTKLLLVYILVQWFVWSQSESVCFSIFYFGSMILGSYIKIYYEFFVYKKKKAIIGLSMQSFNWFLIFIYMAFLFF